MKRIDIADLQHEQIRKTIKATAPGYFKIFIHSNMEATMEAKSGQPGYCIGACSTGADAVLSITIAVIGYNRNCTVARPGVEMEGEHIAKIIIEGKMVFGLSIEHVEHAIPILTNHLR